MWMLGEIAVCCAALGADGAGGVEPADVDPRLQRMGEHGDVQGRFKLSAVAVECSKGSGFGVQRSGCRVQGAGCRVQGSHKVYRVLRVQRVHRVQSFWFRAQG